VLLKLITFTQKFHTPPLKGYVKISLPIRRTEFRKGNEQSIPTREATTVESILILAQYQDEFYRASGGR